jgi:hypothetical protein
MVVPTPKLVRVKLLYLVANITCVALIFTYRLDFTRWALMLVSPHFIFSPLIGHTILAFLGA